MENQVLNIENFSFYYGNTQVLKDINLSIEKNRVTAIMGPSGCGKTTLIRAINRMHELTENTRTEGNIKLNEEDIFKLDPITVRRKIGMVFQKPNPFP
ncbi:MAG: ATP-binding cassette domain-containing protein, partial [Ignavibacteriae bacterium]|nr:ATP-binding cassette domain-containing protein [Ignavibacteriota bacterium]